MRRNCDPPNLITHEKTFNQDKLPYACRTQVEVSNHHINDTLCIHLTYSMESATKYKFCHWVLL